MMSSRGGGSAKADGDEGSEENWRQHFRENKGPFTIDVIHILKFVKFQITPVIFSATFFTPPFG